MGNQNTSRTTHQGILVPDERITNATLKASGAGATESTFNESGPHTGQPVAQSDSDLMLMGAGDQSNAGHLEILTRRAGHPRHGDGGMVWRDVEAGDGTDDYKGHDCYNAVTGWDPLYYQTTNVLEPHLNVLRLASGNLLASGIVDSSGNYEVWPYARATSKWGPGINIGVQDTTNTRQSCLVQLPTRYDDSSTPRVLLFIVTPDGAQIDCYSSDDDGATWALLGARICTEAILDSGGSVPTILRLQAAYNGGQILLAFDYVDTAVFVTQQWASSDNGGNLSSVGSTQSLSAGFLCPSVSALPGGGFLVSCWTDHPSTNGWYSYRVATAWDLLTTGDRAAISTMATNLGTHGSTWVDDTGVAYAIVTSKDAGNTRYEVHAARSSDNGASWAAFNLQAWSFGDKLDYFSKFDIASTEGRAAMLSRWAASPAQNFEGESVACVWLGGYSRHTMPDSTSDVDDSFEDVNALAWADDVGATGDGDLYLPIQLPGSMGWGGGGGGATTLTATTGDCHISTTAGQTEPYLKANAVAHDTAMVEVAVRVPSGGDDSTNQIAVGVRLADNGSYEVEVEVRFDAAGYTVYDVAGTATVGSPVALDMTKERHIRIALQHFPAAGGSGEVQTWHAADAHVREWVTSEAGTTVDAGVTANTNRIQWGHLTAAANDSYWTMVGYCYLVNGWAEDPAYYSIFGSNWSNPECLRTRSYSPHLTGITDGVRLAAESGPTRIGDAWDVKAAYDYPIANVDPRISSSPSQTWRSVDDGSQVELVWDTEALFTDEGYLDNSAIGAFLFGANFKDAYLDGYNGAAWVQIAYMDAAVGYKNLGFTRKGRKVIPSGGTTTADNYLYNEDHVGDTFDLGAAGSEGAAQYVKIKHNTEGAWAGSGTKLPTVTFGTDEMNGGEVSSGTGAIWRQAFGAVVQDYSATYSQLRIRIPVQTTAAGYFEIGTIAIGHLAMLGTSIDNGVAWVALNPVSIVERPGGGSVARSDGKQSREITFALAEGVTDLTQTRTTQPSPDYILGKSGSSLPMAAVRDAARVLDGTIRRAEGAKLPILLLTAVEYLTGGSSSQFETRRDCMLWGRVRTDLFRQSPLGDEGVDELERFQTVTIREEV